MTYIYAVLPISREAYQEIRSKLVLAGYADHIGAKDDRCGNEMIDLRGIALKPQPRRCAICAATLAICDKCGETWCLDHQTNPLVCPTCGARP